VFVVRARQNVWTFLIPPRSPSPPLSLSLSRSLSPSLIFSLSSSSLSRSRSLTRARPLPFALTHRCFVCGIPLGPSYIYTYFRTERNPYVHIYVYIHNPYAGIYLPTHELCLGFHSALCTSLYVHLSQVEFLCTGTYI